MNCIVTAGPTFEPLDDARRLTNFSTGRLGTELANHLAAQGHKVILLIGEQATWAGEHQVQTVRSFSTTSDLRNKLMKCSRRQIDAIFHAAAVSDFAFGQVFAEKEPRKYVAIKTSRKIPTRLGGLLVELWPTPKIIAELRGWFPQATIVGWKFEADGRQREVLCAARRQIKECATDYCVANGPAYGQGFNLVTVATQMHFAGKRGLFSALARIIQRSSPGKTSVRQGHYR